MKLWWVYPRVEVRQAFARSRESRGRTGEAGTGGNSVVRLVPLSDFAGPMRNLLLWAGLICSGNALVATLHRSAPLLRSPHPVAPRHASPLGEASITTSVPYEDLTVGITKEDKPLEKRVAQSPDSVALLVKANFKVVVEKGAGATAEFADDQYEEVGATIVSSAEAWKSDIVIKINPPSSGEAKLVGDRTLISQINPSNNAALLTQFEQQGATVP